VTPPRVVVVGGGIAGLSVARALVARGVRPVVVARGAGASRAGAGIVCTQFWDEALRDPALRGREIVDALVGLRRCGMAQVALSERTAALVGRIEGGRPGLPRDLAGAFSAEFRRRVVLARSEPGDGWVPLPALLRALGAGVRRASARFSGVVRGGVETSAGLLPADRVVVALGAFGPTRIGATALSLRRAETARADVALPAMFHVLDTGLYARPDGRGSVVGDGDAPWEGARPPERLAPSVRTASRMARELGAALGRPVRATPRFAGVLAFTATRRPAVHRDGRVWTLGGFGGDGLSLAPAYGELVAREVLEDVSGPTRGRPARAPRRSRASRP
jgi:glycine/D-amino acid oxidase-like deaminating enzyme